MDSEIQKKTNFRNPISNVTCSQTQLKIVLTVVEWSTNPKSLRLCANYYHNSCYTVPNDIFPDRSHSNIFQIKIILNGEQPSILTNIHESQMFPAETLSSAITLTLLNKS